MIQIKEMQDYVEKSNTENAELVKEKEQLTTQLSNMTLQ